MSGRFGEGGVGGGGIGADEGKVAAPGERGGGGKEKTREEQKGGKQAQ